MNWKLIVVGALVWFITTFAIGMVTGTVIHEGILDPLYEQTLETWRPELREDPPDIGALMPRWIIGGLFGALVVAGLYACFRSALSGPGWKRGMTFGLCMALFATAMHVGWSGVFALPMKIWIWWSIDVLILYLIGGAVLGAVGEKIAPSPS